MKTEKRMVCFIAAAVLLILTLWFTSCGAATAEAEVERKPCYHVTVYSPEIVKTGCQYQQYGHCLLGRGVSCSCPCRAHLS